MDETTPKVLAFDVFGTVVDWHGSIAAEIADRFPDVDAAEFARAWRAGYQPAMASVAQSGEWVRLDDLHLQILRNVLSDFQLSVDEAEAAELNLVWHRLRPWPDSVEAIARLRTRFTVVPLSNGNISLLSDMAKNAGIGWDAVLSAEIVRRYKPDPATYRSVGEIFGVPDSEVMMVAAHHDDLDGAAAAGLRTAYIERPNEYGEDRPKDVSGRAEHPLHFADIAALARHLLAH
ncbi:haloacid dehalogenase type II [Epidermidibacterium keratini]|uniref:Haloacid dehalogenase type II n=1 Tax=Epidermidibacterium keratini TaxID=1891644 RepID=A0A7L4YP14_9ACTN|nr:haloacid dehalogenase type II [Epidermidibacterium keratini]QHC01015.1 haloacid dehalogenase type II [Epidermidibacterium keratini]